MSAVNYYKKFLKMESEGKRTEAWTPLMSAMYGSNNKDYKEVIVQMYTQDWLNQRYVYMDLNDYEWQMTVACILDDADNRQDGIICYLAWQILNQNYRWYDACLKFDCMDSIKRKYSDWSNFKDAMEMKAKQLGFDVRK